MMEAEVDLARALDRMGGAAVASSALRDHQLGGLTLRPHQVTAVSRLLGILGEYRGALLADAVGLGKTYVALAIAREHHHPLLICPAALRTMWERAMKIAGVTIPMVSVESFAREPRIAFEPDLVIVDEAHHLRTPTTRRYASVASMTRRSRVLLLSATPLHNRRRDLTSLLALFLGSPAHTWTDAEVSRVIVRRDETTAEQDLPVLIGPTALSPGADDDCLDAICRLPLPVPAADEGTAAALNVISMVHLWASSRAALVVSLRARRARAIAFRDAIASGHVPTSSELSSWQYADDALQLAFPFCVAGGTEAPDVTDVSRSLDHYAEMVTHFLHDLRRTPDPDVSRAALLRALREAHPDSRIVAFSQYAQTVIALGHHLRRDDRIAVVTSERARIASGVIPRQEILDQFAGACRPVAAAQRVDLILSTDLLSEGVDLRGASVIVNLDLPWNPARIEQRVGRARRLGSRHASTHVYTFVPPAAAERLLDLQKRLSVKMSVAARTVGGSHMPGASNAWAATSPVAEREALFARLAKAIDPIVRRDDAEPLIAAACSDTAGWICVLDHHDMPLFISSSNDEVDEHPSHFHRLLANMGKGIPVERESAAAALQQIDSWLAAARLREVVGLETGFPPAKRAVLNRLSRAVARAPRHRRPALVAAAQRIRAGVSSASGVGAERILRDLVSSSADDESWVHSLEAFAAVHAGDPVLPAKASPSILALILLQSTKAEARVVSAIASTAAVGQP